MRQDTTVIPMAPTDGKDIRIWDIIRDKRIEIAFEPIVSIKKKSVIGLEALAGGDGLPSKALHELAAAQGLTLELDRLVRQKALEGFQGLRSGHPDFLLFLTFDASVVDQGVVGS